MFCVKEILLRLAGVNQWVDPEIEGNYYYYYYHHYHYHYYHYSHFKLSENQKISRIWNINIAYLWKNFTHLSLVSLVCDPTANSVLGRLVVDVSKSCTIIYTYPVGLLCTSDQFAAKIATCTTNTRGPQRDLKPRSQHSSVWSPTA